MSLAEAQYLGTVSLPLSLSLSRSLLANLCIEKVLFKQVSLPWEEGGKTTA